MCSSSPPDPSAELRRQEAERQANVAAGTAKIDEQFAGFNDDFYNTRKQAQTDYYMPQVDDQYQQSYRDAVARLANTGNMTSSAGADLLGKINKQYELSKQGVLDNASSAASQLRSSMAGNRSNLISQLNGGTSIDAVSGSAAAMAQANNAAPSYSALGDLFSGITNTIGNSMLSQALSTPQKQVAGPGLNTSGSSSAVKYIT